MSTPKTNGNGAKEVTPATTNKNNTNGKTTTSTGDNKPKTEEKPAATITPKAEEKAAPVVVEMPKIEAAKPKTLDEQLQFFLGLERLVNIRRRFEAHLEVVKALEIEDEDLTKFETGNNYGVRIELHDNNRREYNITNPRLVKEMQSHLLGLLEGKINDYNTQILTYGEAAQN